MKNSVYYLDNSMDEMYDFLLKIVGIGEEALDLAFGLNGYNKKTACDILYWETGYNDFEEYQKEILEIS